MFGLYVGNTSACIAMLKDDEVQVLVNYVGERVTSASVEVLDNERVVGVAAKAGPNNSGNVIIHSKMCLYPEGIAANEIEGYCPVVVEEGHSKYVVDVGSKKIIVTPKEVVEEIFRYLYNIANSASQENGDANAILTVPYHFSQSAKEEFCEAAISSGFNILQVITDPSAAVMAYENLENESLPRKFVVYRVGGSSMEVSVGVITGGMLQILKSVYEPGIGGDALTAVIFEYLAQDVKMRMQFNPLENSRCRMKLYKLAEHSKHILSTNSLTTCCLETFYNGMDYCHTVTRSRIESLISPVLTQLTKPVWEILEDLNMKADDIDKVILCGGSLKIPKLQKYFKDSFPAAEILNSISPDEVIAVGAAKQGSCHIECLNVPHSILNKDIAFLDTSLYYKVKSSNSFDSLIHRHTVLPVTITKTILLEPEDDDDLNAVVEIHTFGGGKSYDLLKEVVVPKKDLAGKITLELSVDAEGAIDCKVCE
ncbi:heat shock 70 kDa protein 14-B-like [Hetaerina americana]|uniref:heat shock 70 kDa protein 14-B-like n=1 Tax=Hetaerina americana TaxID=62018 RepID=UPI003A7F50B8